MKILLLGQNGQLGWELRRSLAPLGHVTALGREQADLSKPEKIRSLVRQIAPDIVVNAAAHTAVDKAESEPELAQTINATTVGALAEEAARLGAWLMHYSTDYVFDGSGNRPWKENDTPVPLSVYGRSKLQGERLIEQSGCKHLIFRTSWVYATRGANFAKTILRLAQERERLTVIDDQWGAPTGADLLADVTAHALHGIDGSTSDNFSGFSGTYHCAAAGTTNWHAYASLVVDYGRKAGLPIRATEIAAVPTSEFPTPARRPHNSRLDCSKLESTFNLTLPPWEQGVLRMLDESVSVIAPKAA